MMKRFALAALCKTVAGWLLYYGYISGNEYLFIEMAL
jgi:hypothetical protein